MGHSTLFRVTKVYRTLLEHSFDFDLSAVANQMKSQEPQGGAIVAISSISALVGGELQW